MNHILPSTMVFDLDGTLVDTSPDLCSALNHVLQHFGRPEIDPAAVRHLVGHGARAMIRRGLGLSGAVDEVIVEAAMPIFRRYYADHIADGSRPFAGIEAALDRLRAHGVICAICTNKPEMLARQLIAALGWDGRFAAILGGDSVDRCKPDAQHVTATIAAAAGQRVSSVFVGDSSVDVAAARAAKIPVIVVGFGFADQPVAELGADAVIGHYDELLPLLRSRRW